MLLKVMNKLEKEILQKIRAELQDLPFNISEEYWLEHILANFYTVYAPVDANFSLLAPLKLLAQTIYDSNEATALVNLCKSIITNLLNDDVQFNLTSKGSEVSAKEVTSLQQGILTFKRSLTKILTILTGKGYVRLDPKFLGRLLDNRVKTFFELTVDEHKAVMTALQSAELVNQEHHVLEVIGRKITLLTAPFAPAFIPINIFQSAVNENINVDSEGTPVHDLSCINALALQARSLSLFIQDSMQNKTGVYLGVTLSTNTSGHMLVTRVNSVIQDDTSRERTYSKFNTYFLAERIPIQSSIATYIFHNIDSTTADSLFAAQLYCATWIIAAVTGMGKSYQFLEAVKKAATKHILKVGVIAVRALILSVEPTTLPNGRVTNGKKYEPLYEEKILDDGLHFHSIWPLQNVLTPSSLLSLRVNILARILQSLIRLLHKPTLNALVIERLKDHFRAFYATSPERLHELCENENIKCDARADFQDLISAIIKNMTELATRTTDAIEGAICIFLSTVNISILVDSGTSNLFSHRPDQVTITYGLVWDARILFAQINSSVLEDIDPSLLAPFKVIGKTGINPPTELIININLPSVEHTREGLLELLRGSTDGVGTFETIGSGTIESRHISKGGAKSAVKMIHIQ